MAKNKVESEWDLGWDENWDSNLSNDKTASSSAQESEPNALELAVGTQSINQSAKLEDVLRVDPNARDELAERGFDLKWGTQEESLKPTNLKQRLIKLVNPFSKVIDQEIKNKLPDLIKTQDNEKPSTERPAPEYIKPVLDLPKFQSSIIKELDKPIQNLGVALSELEFNNLNSISPSELDDVDGLLEGSLGTSPNVNLDQTILSDKSANIVQFEKEEKKRVAEKAKQDIEDQKKKQIELAKETSSEETIASETPLDATLVPELTDIRFDLKTAQENTDLFDPHEINQVLQRIPIERERLQLEFAGPDEKDQSGMNQAEIGASLFEAVPNAPSLQDEGVSSTDDLLDSLLDEIDDELGESSFGDSQFDQLSTESLGQDEILSEDAILNDDENAALEFMDTASMEVESMFEDFFKQGSGEDTAKAVEKKPSLVQKLKAKVNELKGTYQLFLRFLKDPKYFFEYYHITLKDVYVAIGFLFCLIIYTGFINYQNLTQRFPMNLF